MTPEGLPENEAEMKVWLARREQIINWLRREKGFTKVGSIQATDSFLETLRCLVNGAPQLETATAPLLRDASRVSRRNRS